MKRNQLLFYEISALHRDEVIDDTLPLRWNFSNRLLAGFSASMSFKISDGFQCLWNFF
jgi:hypothetical protein